jgi:hypothetical protein
VGRIWLALSVVEFATGAVVLSSGPGDEMMAAALASAPMAWRSAQWISSRLAGASPPITTLLEIWQTGKTI